MPRRRTGAAAAEGAEGEGGEGEGQPAASPGFEEELDFLEDEGEASPATRARAERERLRAQASARRASLSELIPGFDQLLQQQQQKEDPSGPRPGAAPRGKRAKKPKSDAEVAESVGRVVQRLVKGLEAEVAGNLELYAASQIFPDRALKSAKRAFDVVFDRAWKKIEVNLLVAEAEARNDTAEEERWAEQVLGAGDWQASLRTMLTEGTGRRTLAPERDALDALRSVPMPRRAAEVEGLLVGAGPVDATFDVRSEFDFVHEKAKAATAGGRPHHAAGAGPGGAGGAALEPKFAHHAKQTIGARAW